MIRSVTAAPFEAEASGQAARRAYEPPNTWFRIVALNVAISVLWPRYAYMALGGLPSLTLTFIAAGLTCAAIVYKSAASPSFRRVLLSPYAGSPVLTALLLVWFLWQLVCDFGGVSPPTSFMNLVSDCQTLINMLAIGAVVSSVPRYRFGIFRLLVLVTIAVCLAAVFERVTFQPIIFYFPSAMISGLGQSNLGFLFYPLVRDNVFRVRSTFAHPIVFAQFCAAMAPVCWLVFRNDTAKIFRLLALGAMPLIVIGIQLSGARSGFMSLAAAVATVLVLNMLRNALKGGKNAVGSLVTLVVLVVGVGLAATFLQDLTAGRTETEANSGHVRLQQLARAELALDNSPVTGYGSGMSGRFAGIEGMLGIISIDCNYISMAVDFGYPGLAIYVVMILAFLGTGIKIALSKRSSDWLSAEASAVTAGIVAMLVTFAILSITDMLSLFYMYVPFLMSMSHESSARTRSTVGDRTTAARPFTRISSARYAGTPQHAR